MLRTQVLKPIPLKKESKDSWRKNHPTFTEVQVKWKNT